MRRFLRFSVTAAADILDPFAARRAVVVIPSFDRSCLLDRPFGAEVLPKGAVSDARQSGDRHASPDGQRPCGVEGYSRSLSKHANDGGGTNRPSHGVESRGRTVGGMAFLTPRGLKIRLPVAYAFTLLSRLYPRRKPESVLRTAEGLDYLPSFLWELSAIATIADGATWPFTILTSVLVRALGVVILALGFFPLPGVDTLPLYYSYVPSLVRWLGYPLAAYFLAGWLGVGTWLASFAVSGLAQMSLESAFTRARFRKSGAPIIGTSELLFLHAYRLHAQDVDAPLNLGCSEDEIANSEWAALAATYAETHPGVITDLGPASGS